MTERTVDLPAGLLSANKQKQNTENTWKLESNETCSFSGGAQQSDAVPHFRRPPWNIMLQNTIYLIQNDTDSAIRGFQQVSKPGALSFCIKGHKVSRSMVVWAREKEKKGSKWRGVLATLQTTLLVKTVFPWQIRCWDVYCVYINIIYWFQTPG